MFSLFVSIRNTLYDIGIIKQIHSPFQVISIGNISVGGTGKTPITMMIARMCNELHIPISLLSSGYKRTGKGSITIVRDNQLNPTIDPATIGDEVYMHAETGLYTTVVSCQPKYKAIREFSTPILIDDGFQHRKIFRDLDIVLINNKDLNDVQLPFGRLRESPRSLNRANIVICTDDTPEHDVRTFMNAQALFIRVRMQLGTPFFLDKLQTIDYRNNAHIMAVAGIANPERFLQTLQGNAFNVQHFRWYADHAQFKDDDIQNMCTEAKQHDCSIIAITEKDAVKLRDKQAMFKAHGIQLLVIPIHAEIIEGKTAFQEILSSICSHYILPE